MLRIAKYASLRKLGTLLLSLVCFQTTIGVIDAGARDNTQAGIAAAVTGELSLLSSKISGKAPVQIMSGTPFSMFDTLLTSERSYAQLLFLDESAMMLGPKSELLVDEFVYDPSNANSNSTLTAQFSRGVLRYVTGAISHEAPQGVRIEIPQATLVIRGTTVLVSCQDDACVVGLAGTGDQNNAALKKSTLTITSARGEAEIRRAGFFVTVSDNGTVSQPLPWDTKLEGTFTTLFDNMNSFLSMIALQQIERSPEVASASGVRMTDASGQSVQDGQALANDQQTFNEATVVGPLAAGSIDKTVSIPNAKISYASAVSIPFGGGSGTGQYDVEYKLDMRKRSADGHLTVTTFGPGAFSTSIPLTGNPFEKGSRLSQEGSVPDVGNALDTYRFDYEVGRSGIESHLQYDVDGVGAAPPSTGSGITPAAD